MTCYFFCVFCVSSSWCRKLAVSCICLISWSFVSGEGVYILINKVIVMQL